MCGVFGAYSLDARVGEDVYLGLLALQHRGQASAGVAWIEDGCMQVVKRMGLVSEALDQGKLAHNDAKAMIGHVRYPTAGSVMVQNASPIGADCVHGPIAVAHNGNITNFVPLRRALESRGAIFQSGCDSELILHLLAHQPKREPLDALLRALPALRGAYSMVMLSRDGLCAVRDPWGFHPLCLGRRDNSWYVASESCAFALIGAKFVRDIEPGEVLVINETGLKSHKMPSVPEHRRLCSFEFVYFARPDSVIEGVSVYEARKEMGRRLSHVDAVYTTSSEHPDDSDFVTTLPDSGTTAALGYAQESGLPYEGAVVRNRYVGRTFIQPTQRVRELGVRTKLSPSEYVLDSKRVVIVDDSLVRGTTAGLVVSMIRESGAHAVHLSLSSPPVICPCYYGIDTPSRGELIAANCSLDEIAASVGADTLRYLSRDDMIGAIGLSADRLCTACFDGDYLDKEDVPASLEFLDE